MRLDYTYSIRRNSNNIPYCNILIHDHTYGSIRVWSSTVLNSKLTNYLLLIGGNVKLNLTQLFYTRMNLILYCTPTVPPTQKFKNGISTLVPHEIVAILVSFLMILKVLQTEPFRFKINLVG